MLSAIRSGICASRQITSGMTMDTAAAPACCNPLIQGDEAWWDIVDAVIDLGRFLARAFRLARRKQGRQQAPVRGQLPASVVPSNSVLTSTRRLNEMRRFVNAKLGSPTATQNTHQGNRLDCLGVRSDRGTLCLASRRSVEELERPRGSR